MTDEQLHARVAALEDREALRMLLVEYFRGFEAKRSDDAWLQSIFTDDVTVDVPAGTHEGLAGLGDLTGRIAGLWDRTLHMLSEHAIALDGDRASVTAVLHATHVHHADDPGAHLHIGGYVDAEAVRTPAGWRLRQLAIRLVWTEGDPPADRRAT
jgi:hypothetical protein